MGLSQTGPKAAAASLEATSTPSVLLSTHFTLIARPLSAFLIDSNTLGLDIRFCFYQLGRGLVSSTAGGERVLLFCARFRSWGGRGFSQIRLDFGYDWTASVEQFFSGRVFNFSYCIVGWRDLQSVFRIVLISILLGLMSAPDLLRLALTYSLAIYEDAADGSSEYHLASVFNGVDDALLSDEVRVWKSKTPHPWTMSSAIVATIETTKEKDVVPDLKCVLYYHAARKGLYVTFRGTHNMENAITDLKYFQEILDVSVFLPPSDVGWKESTPVVHSGFHAAYLCLRPRLLMAIKEALSSLTHCTDVICVGHSLGGALANFAALDISINKAQFRPNWNSGLVTFGAPMVGNQAFVDYCNDAVVNSLRIANRLDPVAHCLEAGKVTASWLSHNHEPYVHAGRTALVLELGEIAHFRLRIEVDTACDDF